MHGVDGHMLHCQARDAEEGAGLLALSRTPLDVLSVAEACLAVARALREVFVGEFTGPV